MEDGRFYHLLIFFIISAQVFIHDAEKVRPITRCFGQNILKCFRCFILRHIRQTGIQAPFLARICLAINILFLFSALASGVTGGSRIMPKYSLRRFAVVTVI